MNKSIKAIAFDLGRVLFDFDYTIGLRRIHGRVAAADEEIINSLYREDFSLDFERGEVSEHDFYLRFKNRFKSDLSFAEFISAWSQIFQPNDDIIALADGLRNEYPLYMISNICKPHYAYLQSKYPDVFSLFRGLILSFQVRAVKPEPAIYQALREKAGCRFSQIIYIDDRQDLISPARSLGLCCIRFEDYHQLCRALSRYGIRAGAETVGE